MTTVSLAVFIFLLWLILFRRKDRKGRPLNRAEMAILVGGFIFAGGGFFLQALDFFGDVPPYLMPYLPYIWQVIWIGLIVIVPLFVLISISHRKERIRKSLAKTICQKLELKIRAELENEVAIRKLTFPNQSKGEPLSILAKRVSYDIMEIQTPKKYHVQQSEERSGDVWIDNDMLTLPLPSAVAIADKMTELSKNPKYRRKRRWLYLFWV